MTDATTPALKPEEYYRVEDHNHGLTLPVCPVCFGKTELWQYTNKSGNGSQKVIMCTTTAEDMGADELIGGCPLYMPPISFYRATYREALAEFNHFRLLLGKVQAANKMKANSGGG